MKGFSPQQDTCWKFRENPMMPAMAGEPAAPAACSLVLAEAAPVTSLASDLKMTLKGRFAAGTKWLVDLITYGHPGRATAKGEGVWAARVHHCFSPLYEF